MGRIIAISNQKGGVGKTTTAINLSACLAEKGKKVLTIDMDPQGNTTSGLGIDKNEVEDTSYEVLLGEAKIENAITKSIMDGLFVVPSERGLAGAEIELIGKVDREFILKKEVERIKDDYDFIIIDCPPSLGLITLNAFAASDSILIPIQCEYYALEGLSQLTKTIKLVKQGINPNLHIEGVLLTMYDSRTNLSVQIAEDVRKYFGATVYKTVIPRNVRLSEAPSYGRPIMAFDNKSKGAECYKKLANEVIKMNKQ